MNHNDKDHESHKNSNNVQVWNFGQYRNSMRVWGLGFGFGCEPLELRVVGIGCLGEALGL